MTILSQPDDIRFGDYLNILLAEVAFMDFTASVAFVSSSGAQALQNPVETLLARGGRARFIVGVSRKVTTVEGLGVLLQLVSKGADVFVFHNENPSVIYHPKGYLIDGPDKAVLLVGSNNLTGKGLYENYELSVASELDPKDKKDAAVIKAAKDVFDRFANTNTGLCKALTLQFLNDLNDDGYLGSEAKGTNTPEEAVEGEVTSPPVPPKKKLFGSKAVPPGPKFAQKAAAGTGLGVAGGNAGAALAKPALKPAAVPTAPTQVPAAPGPLGALVWEKELSPSDAQQSTGNTNPVGGIRLTQARWKVGGQVINQTDYFRNKVFGQQSWKTKKQKPYGENTYISAEVIIKGKSLGLKKLEVSHKPSGEAGQGNYTTQIHWGDLNPTIKGSQLSGRRLRLYAPATGSNRFTIDIS